MNADIGHRVFLLISAAWRRRYMIATPMLVLPLIGIAVGLLAPKKFESHTSILVQETSKMNPFLQDFAVSAKLKERTEALGALIKSRHILRAVAEERGMINKDDKDEHINMTIAQLAGSIDMKVSGKDLFIISMKSSSSAGLKENLESVSKHFVEQMLSPERSAMKDSAFFLSEHLKRRKEELQNAETDLAKYKDSFSEELPEMHSANVARLESLKQLLSEKEAQLSGTERSLGGIKQQLTQTNPVLGKLEEQIIRIRGELALLRARYTDDHSKVQGAIRQLSRLENERQIVIKQEPNNVNIDNLWDMASQSNDKNGAQGLLVSQLNRFQETRSKHDQLSDETERLKKIIAELELKVAGAGEHERRLSELTRDLSVKRKLYEDLLQRYEMARVTGSLGSFESDKRVRVIDQPFTPTKPSNLPTIVFAIAGLFGGLFMGIGLAMVAEFTDHTVRRREQVERLLGAPMLARIPPLAPVK
jgi:polysaccharide chain length determinant protein (PEP-CTERM system associated)